MSWIGVGVAGVGAVTSIVGGMQANSAASSAAKRQRDEAIKQRQAIMNQAAAYRGQLSQLSEANPRELAILDQSLGAAQKQVDSDMKLMQALDPAILEASKQALQVLRGDQAQFNAPGQQQRQKQRMELVNQLRAQFGPNAETTAAGRKALDDFDMGTAQFTSQQQQNSLGQLFGIGSTRVNGAGQGNLMNVFGGFNNIQNRKLTAATNAGSAELGALSGTSQSMIDNAGADFVGAGLQGRQNQQFGNMAMNLGALYGGSQMGKPKAPTAAGTAPTLNGTVMSGNDYGPNKINFGSLS